MNYLEKFTLIIEEIDKNLGKESLDTATKAAARISQTNIKTLCGVFSFIVGMSLGEYHRKRTLTTIYEKYLTGGVTLEALAAEYGYSDASALSKAFSGCYFKSPKIAKIEGTSPKELTSKFSLNQPPENNRKFVPMHEEHEMTFSTRKHNKPLLILNPNEENDMDILYELMSFHSLYDLRLEMVLYLKQLSSKVPTIEGVTKSKVWMEDACFLVANDFGNIHPSDLSETEESIIYLMVAFGLNKDMATYAWRTASQVYKIDPFELDEQTVESIVENYYLEGYEEYSSNDFDEEEFNEQQINRECEPWEYFFDEDYDGGNFKCT